MKSLVLLVVLSLMASPAFGQSAQELRDIFNHQVSAVGKLSPVFEKRVQELDKKGGLRETKRYKLKPALASDSLRMIDENGAVFSFLDELKIATEIVATDPSVREHFRFSQKGDTTISQRDPVKGKLYVDLALQRTVRAADGKLRYIFSDIERMSWLYGSAFTIEVWFDKQGQYQRHVLTFWSRLFLQGEQGHVQVEGRLLTP